MKPVRNKYFKKYNVESIHDLTKKQFIEYRKDLLEYRRKRKK